MLQRKTPTTKDSGGSGLSYFKLKNSSGTELASGTSSLSYIFKDEQSATYTLEAKDKAGNVTTKTITIKIDKTKPTISNVSSTYGWTKNNVTISPKVNDNLSGVISVILKDSNGTELKNESTSFSYTFTKEGSNTYTLRVKDNAGNVSTKSFTVKIDKTAPTIKDVNELYDWTNKAVRLKPTSTDTYSGVKSLELYDASSKLIASGTNSFSYDYKKEGVSRLTLKATDNVGNVSVINITIKQDFAKPEVFNGTDIPNDELNAKSNNGYFYSRNEELLFETTIKDQTNLSGIMTAYIWNPNGEMVYKYDNRQQEIDGRYNEILVSYDLEKSPIRKFKGLYFTMEVYDYAGNVFKKKILFIDTFNMNWVRVIIS